MYAPSSIIVSPAIFTPAIIETKSLILQSEWTRFGTLLYHRGPKASTDLYTASCISQFPAIAQFAKFFDGWHNFSRNDNKIVEFKVEQDTFYIEESDYDLSQLWKPGERIVLKKNLELDSLVPVNLLRERLSTAVGNKAANFGELDKFSKKLDFETPESAFAIPFYFYQKHVNNFGAQTAINALLEKDNRKRYQDEVRKDLESIQNMILNNEVSESLLNDVERMIIRQGDFRRKIWWGLK